MNTPDQIKSTLFKTQRYTLMRVGLVFFLIFLWSCQPSETPAITIKSLQLCHDERGWDKQSVEQHLIGRWRWIYAKCLEFQEEAEYQIFKGLIIQFFSDQTCEITYNGVSPQTGTYNVAPVDGKHFSIKITPELRALKGKILFCEDELEFNQGIEGCSNFFKITF